MSKGQGEGWLRCFTHPLGGGGMGHAQYPAFAPGFSKVAVGVPLVSFHLVSKIYLNYCMSALTFNLINFLYILLLKERCVQVQALQRCS